MKKNAIILTVIFLYQTLLFSQEWTIFNTTNTPQTGPSNNTIYDITQDKQSNLWFVTDNGVCSFDGQNWNSYYAVNNNGQDNSFYKIAFDSNNKIYLGARWWSGGFATLLNGNIELIKYIHVYDMEIDSLNTVWLACLQGLLKYENSSFIDISDQHELLSNWFYTVEVDQNNHIWAGTENGVLYYNDTAWQHITTDDGLPDNFVYLIESDSKNNIWMMSVQGLSKFDGNGWEYFTSENGLIDDEYNDMMIDDEDNIWISTENNGLMKFDGIEFSVINTETGLKDNNVLTCYKDNNQNLWIGYYNSYGVDKYNGYEFTNYSGNGINSISVLRYNSDKLWVGTVFGGLNIFDGESWVNHNISNGFISNWIYDISMDADNNHWIATGNGLSKFEGTNITNYTINEGLPDNAVSSICVDNNNNVWIGTIYGGAAMFDGSYWTYYNALNSLLGNNIRAIVQDYNNIMWFSNAKEYFNGEIVSYDGTNWQSYQPINEGFVKDMVCDFEGNLWFGYFFNLNTEYTIAKFDGFDWETFIIPDTVDARDIFDIYEDKDSLLWFGRSLNGVTTFDGENWVNYDSDDGYPETSNRAITQDADGNMWIGSWKKGLYKHNVGTNVAEPGKNNGFNEFTVFPNPASDIISIKSTKDYTTLKKAQLYNTRGKLLQEKEFRFDMIFDIQDLNPGVYIIKISNKFYNYSEKIIKK